MIVLHTIRITLCTTSVLQYNGFDFVFTYTQNPFLIYRLPDIAIYTLMLKCIQ